MESVDQFKHSEADEGEISDLAAERPTPIWHFWRTLLAAIAMHAALTWVIDAIPVRTGETLALRWLRALVEHPIRGPLGLGLGALALVQLVRAVFNRVSHS